MRRMQIWQWLSAALFVFGLAAGRAGAYAVNYDGNGADSGTVPSAQTKEQDVALTLAGTPDALVRTNYAFVCWNTATNGSGTDYSPGAGYTSNASVTLYAKWTPYVPLKRYTAVPRPELAADPDDNGSGSYYMDDLSFRGSDLRAPFACTLGVLGVGDESGSIIRYRAGLYENGSHHELGIPAGYVDSYVAGISESLVVAATAYEAHGPIGHRVAYVVPHGGTPTELPINQHGSVARSISSNGYIAGHTFADDAGSNTLAALWSPSGAAWSLQTFAPLAGDTRSAAAAVNNQGDVVGWSGTSTGSKQVLWLHDNPTPLVLTNVYSASQVNDLGQVLGYSASYESIIWSGSSGTVRPENGIAAGFAALGSQGEVVGFGKGSIFNGAVVAELDALVTAGDLRLNAYEFGGIDDNGRIIAYGYRIHPDGTPADRYPPDSWSAGGKVRYSYFELTPVEDADAYVVTYHANGATSGHVPVRQAKIPDKPLALPSNGSLLAKPGYTFAGWNTAADGSGTHYDVGSLYTANAALTLYPEWTTQATYLVKYFVSGFGTTSVNAPFPQTKVHGQPLTLAHNYTHFFRPGYVFGGWTTATDGSGVDYAEGATYLNNAPLTLYSKWIATDTRFPVVYVNDYPDGLTGTYPSDQFKTLGVALTLATNSGNLAKPGYTFAGWSTGDGSGNGTDYAEGASYTRDEPLTLCAKWVVSGNASPVISSAWADANIVTLPPVGTTGTTVHVTATDPNGDTLYYVWSKVSGPGTTTFAAYSATNSTVTFNAVGTFVLRVTVSDLKSVNATADVTVRVNGAPTVPAVPADFVAVAAGTNRIDLGWSDNATNETSYVLERSSDGSLWNLATLAGVDATNHSDTTLAPGTLYNYRVSAYNAVGPSAYAYASARTWEAATAYEAWRQTYFTLAQRADPAISGDEADPDGDGLTNWKEYRAGTDPLRAESCLALSAPTISVAEAGKFVVRWSSVTGKTYALEFATHLSAGFMDLKTNIPATPTINVYTDDVGSVASRFYRVKVE